MTRIERFMDALETMVEAGEEYESEIQSELERLDKKDLSDFTFHAAAACSLCGGLLRNLLNGAEVKIPEPAAAGVSS